MAKNQKIGKSNRSKSKFILAEKNHNKSETMKQMNLISNSEFIEGTEINYSKSDQRKSALTNISDKKQKRNPKNCSVQLKNKTNHLI